MVTLCLSLLSIDFIVNNLSIADKIDFLRDIIAFMAVIGIIIAVAFDGVVSKQLYLQLLYVYMCVLLLDLYLFYWYRCILLKHVCFHCYISYIWQGLLESAMCE